MTEKLILEKIDNTAQITINNPSANTWDLESLSGLQEIIENLNKDDNIFALVITGQGDKFFSAGADLKVFHEGGKEAAKEMSNAFSEAFESLSNFRGVSIAAINGFAMGGGLECALACDIRVAEEKAVLALPEPKVGLLPCGGGTQVLPRLVGEGWAKRIILTGEQIKAEQALKIGLIEEKVQEDAREKSQVLQQQTAVIVELSNFIFSHLGLPIEPGTIPGVGEASKLMHK